MPADFFEFLVTNPTYLLSVFFLILARVMPIVILLPFFGAKVLPNPARVGMSIAIALLMLPFIASLLTQPLTFDARLVALAFKEVVMGFLIGFLALAPFVAAQMAGMVIDHQRGSASLMVNDPTQSVQVSTMGLLYSYLMVVVFFWLDGPSLFFDALIKSYQMLPPDRLPSAALFQLDAPILKKLLSYLTYITALSCQMAAPSLLMILMSNVFLGIINRLAPQVQITFLGLSLNAYLGDLAMWAAWLFIVDRMGIESLKWMRELTNLLQSLVPA